MNTFSIDVIHCFSYNIHEVLEQPTEYFRKDGEFETVHYETIYTLYTENWFTPILCYA